MQCRRTRVGKMSEKKASSHKRSFDVAFLTSRSLEDEKEPVKNSSAFSKYKDNSSTKTPDKDTQKNEEERSTKAAAAAATTTYPFPFRGFPPGVETSHLTNNMAQYPALRKLLDMTGNGFPAIPAPDVVSVSPILPPTLALGLGASNTCAKCGVTFRMTSDLVYHMRTHHAKNENKSYDKRRECDRLKCNVCGENFRERHHLTRHMTAHQDRRKNEDQNTSEAGQSFTV